MKKTYIIWFLLGAAFAFTLRVLLLPYGNHNDLITNTGWSEWIYIYGTRGFYGNRVWVFDWPTQLPLMNLIYDFNYVIYGKTLWLITMIRNIFMTYNFLPTIFKHWSNFVSWFGWTYYLNTPFVTGHIISMKLLPIISDIIIGLVVFLIGSKYADRRKGLLASLLYLLSPFSIYISSLWGQYDQLSALFLLLSFYFIYIGKESTGKFKYWYLPLSVIVYFIAVEVKPIAVFTAPFYAFYILRQKPKLWSLVISFLVGLFVVTTIPFTEGNTFFYTINTIFPKVFNQTRNVLSTQAFNFWELISPMKQSSLDFTMIGIKAILWGYLFLVILNAISIFIISRKNDLKNMVLGLFITTGGSYIFATGMLDRYYFAGLVFFLILTMFYNKTLILWLAAALLFSINLFVSWGYPVNLQLHDVFWANYPLVRILSFLQTGIFVLMVIISFKSNNSIKLNRGRTK